LNIDDVYYNFLTQVFFEFYREKAANSAKSVLMILPEYDYDPTEVSVCWKVLTSSGINVVFATEKRK